MTLEVKNERHAMNESKRNESSFSTRLVWSGVCGDQGFMSNKFRYFSALLDGINHSCLIKALPKNK